MSTDTLPPDAKRDAKRAGKTSRIPIKIVPAEPLRKPDWIRVRAGGGERFQEIKRILRESDDPGERRETWEASKTVGAAVADDVPTALSGAWFDVSQGVVTRRD